MWHVPAYSKGHPPRSRDARQARCAMIRNRQPQRSDTGEMLRRDFLKLTVGASSGLLLGFFVPVAGGNTPDSRTFAPNAFVRRSEEHTSELQSRFDLVCRL